jgi:hypothetical protein
VATMTIVMGPPGSGKSTLYDERYFCDRGIRYVSGDSIALDLKAARWQPPISLDHKERLSPARETGLCRFDLKGSWIHDEPAKSKRA